MIDALVEAGASRSAGFPRMAARAGSNPGRPEGRWSLLEPSAEDEESQRLAWISVLLDRYGVVTRELVELDPWAPSWAELAPCWPGPSCAASCAGAISSRGSPASSTPREEAADELARLAGSALAGSRRRLARRRRPGQPLRQRAPWTSRCSTAARPG